MMKVNRWVAGLIAATGVGVIVVACGGGSDEPINVSSGTVFKNATVVNTRDGSLQSGVTVVVDGGKIQTITTRFVNPIATAVAIDATGKFVVPGYLDMHTHALGSLAKPPGDFPVLLANGVTGVREASGSPALIAAARAQNANVIAGTADAPEILMLPSAIAAGPASPATAAAGVQFVKDRKAEGADFIKVASGTRDGVLAMLAEVKNQGYPAFHVAGHLVPTVTPLESTNAGWHSIEHLGAGWGLLIGCSTDEDNIRTASLANPAPPGADVVNPRLYDGNNNAQYYQRIIDTYSETKCVDLLKAFVKNDTWQPVTLIRLRTSDYGDDPAYANDPNLIYVDKTRKALWAARNVSYATTVTPAARATLQSFYQLRLKVAKLMQQNGVKILAGSDLGGGWVIPGFGLHQEFRELAIAGLTPLQILQSTTINGAQFVGREATMGTVEVGKNADLVLLDANPLADVANLSKISHVVLRGKVYTRATLDKIKTDVAAAYAAMPTSADLTSALDPTHTD